MKKYDSDELFGLQYRKVDKNGKPLAIGQLLREQLKAITKEARQAQRDLLSDPYIIKLEKSWGISRFKRDFWERLRKDSRRPLRKV